MKLNKITKIMLILLVCVSTIAVGIRRGGGRGFRGRGRGVGVGRGIGHPGVRAAVIGGAVTRDRGYYRNRYGGYYGGYYAAPIAVGAYADGEDANSDYDSSDNQPITNYSYIDYK